MSLGQLWLYCVGGGVHSNISLELTLAWNPGTKGEATLCILTLMLTLILCFLGEKFQRVLLSLGASA